MVAVPCWVQALPFPAILSTLQLTPWLDGRARVRLPRQKAAGQGWIGGGTSCSSHCVEQMKGAILCVFSMGTEASALPPPPLLLQLASQELSTTMAVVRSVAALAIGAQWFWRLG